MQPPAHAFQENAKRTQDHGNRAVPGSGTLFRVKQGELRHSIRIAGDRPKVLLRSFSDVLRRAFGEVDNVVRNADPLGMGTKLGPYTLEQKIGQGGMGAVYRARHDRLPRPVAIKLLRTKVAGEESLELFLREVQQTSRLTHPSTVQIYDFGVAQNGIYYYAMEYIEGLTLDELVMRYGPLPPGRVIYIIAQVAHALAEAHEMGLVHRDIKPANILLCDRGGVVDFPKLVDFGLVADLQAPIDPNDSRPRMLLGTPMYMAPEALTESHRVDARTDLYALGAVAYYMLSGEDLFDDPRDVDQLVAMQLRQEPITPSERLRKKLPRDLERLVMQCLAKSPLDRPGSALSLREALLNCLDARCWGMREAETWWAEEGISIRRRSADGTRLSGTSRDDTSRIPEWQRRTDRIRG
jgi:serine/threonine-protein kinase